MSSLWFKLNLELHLQNVCLYNFTLANPNVSNVQHYLLSYKTNYRPFRVV